MTAPIQLHIPEPFSSSDCSAEKYDGSARGRTDLYRKAYDLMMRVYRQNICLQSAQMHQISDCYAQSEVYDWVLDTAPKFMAGFGVPTSTSAKVNKPLRLLSYACAYPDIHMSGAWCFKEVDIDRDSLQMLVSEEVSSLHLSEVSDRLDKWRAKIDRLKVSGGEFQQHLAEGEALSFRRLFDSQGLVQDKDGRYHEKDKRSKVLLSQGRFLSDKFTAQTEQKTKQTQVSEPEPEVLDKTEHVKSLLSNVVDGFLSDWIECRSNDVNLEILLDNFDVLEESRIGALKQLERCWKYIYTSCQHLGLMKSCDKTREEIEHIQELRKSIPRLVEYLAPRHPYRQYLAEDFKAVGDSYLVDIKKIDIDRIVTERKEHFVKRYKECLEGKVTLTPKSTSQKRQGGTDKKTTRSTGPR